MNSWSLFGFVIIALVACVSATTTNKCPAYCRYKTGDNPKKTTLRVRKDIKCLSEQEWTAFRDAVITAHKTGVMDRFNYIHTKYFYVIHDSAFFFPWHRWFLYLFETELRKINPNVTLPYWDGATDFVNPATSEVFNATRGGGGGDPMKEMCVKDGMCKDWIRKFPILGCVKRNVFDNTLPPWHSPEWTTHLLQAGFDYDSFREGLEFSVHALMHGNIGGPMGELMWPWGPNDIMFFFLHTNVDRIWAKWQLQDPKNYYDYAGGFKDIQHNKTTRAAKLDDIVDPWTLTVKEAMIFAKEPLPYTYDEFLSDIPDKEETETQRRLSELPDEVLTRFFPKIADKTANRYHFDAPPVCGAEVDGTIPRPVQINPMTLTARGFDADRAMAVEADSNMMIDVFNQVGYSTPYK